jgi:hypothetical protein
LTHSNSFTVPVTETVFSASNMAKEWCAEAGTTKSDRAATAASPKALTVHQRSPSFRTQPVHTFVMQRNAGASLQRRLTSAFKRTYGMGPPAHLACRNCGSGISWRPPPESAVRRRVEKAPRGAPLRMPANETEDPEHPLRLDRVYQIRDLSYVLPHRKNIIGTNGHARPPSRAFHKGVWGWGSVQWRATVWPGRRAVGLPRPARYGRTSVRSEARRKDTFRLGCRPSTGAWWP